MNQVIAAVAGGFGVGIGSALFPLLNVEAFVLVIAGTNPQRWWWWVVGAAMGEMVGKITIFLASRHGARWVLRRSTALSRSGRISQWWSRQWLAPRVWIAQTNSTLLASLDRPIAGSAVTALSATAGIPPLALLTIVAGTRRTSLPLFAGIVLIGRGARFALLAWSAAAAAS